MTSKFIIEGFNFDRATRATVSIDRVSGIVEIRPYRRHRVYRWPLADMARRICWLVEKAEAIERKRAKTGAR